MARPRAEEEVEGEQPAGHGRIPRPAPSLPSEGCNASPPPFPCACAEGRRTGLGAAGTAAPPAGEPRNSPARRTEPGRAELPQGKKERARKGVLTCVGHRDTVISAPRGLHAEWAFLLSARFTRIPHSSTALVCWKRVKSDSVRDGAAPPKCDITLSLHVYPQHTVSYKG